ncbi:MAG: hypothetical protein WC860_02075 [Candidatus Margulisiibacteriota bacterium]|jgi:hypothetical protein
MTISSLDPKVWNNGIASLKAIARREEVTVKKIRNGEEYDLDPKRTPLQTNLIGYLTHIAVAGAAYTAPERGAGPLFKKTIDGRGTDGQKSAIKSMIKDLDAVQISVLTGEGPKDAQSVYIPTGTVFSNVADPTIVKQPIHTNHDPVDGTNNVCGKNKDNSFVAGGTSIVLFATPKDPHKPAFTAFPDEVSVWSYSTPIWMPKVGLTMIGKSVEEVVETNVKKVANGFLTQKLGRLPSEEEVANFIRNDFKVVLMNRPFQNSKVLAGLKKAGMNIDYKVDAKGNIDFSTWVVDGDSLAVKHFRKGNVLIVGDGNIMVPYMKDVHLNIGNGGGPETLQLLPGVKEMAAVFLSKEKRTQMPLDEVLNGMFKANQSNDLKEKEAALNKLFSEKEKKALLKHGFDATKTFTVFTKDSLLKNTMDYITTFAAITPLEKSRALFDVPGMSAVKINTDNDTIETSAMAICGSGDQYLVKEKFILKSRPIKANLMNGVVNIDKVINKSLTEKEVSEVKDLVTITLGNYLALAKEYIFYGCFDQSKLILNDLHQYISYLEKNLLIEGMRDIYKTICYKDKNLMKYIGQLQDLMKITSSDLKNKANLQKLKEMYKQNSYLVNSDITPGVDHWLKKDLRYLQDELVSYIKVLEK